MIEAETIVHLGICADFIERNEEAPPNWLVMGLPEPRGMYYPTCPYCRRDMNLHNEPGQLTGKGFAHPGCVNASLTRENPEIGVSA